MWMAVPPAMQPELFGLMEEMDRFHPKEPHWYLPMIGTDPVYQGIGFGAAAAAVRSGDTGVVATSVMDSMLPVGSLRFPASVADEGDTDPEGDAGQNCQTNARSGGSRVERQAVG